MRNKREKHPPVETTAPARWLACLVAAWALGGCPTQDAGPDPILEADPPPTEDGKPPGAGQSDFDRGLAYAEKGAFAEAIPHFERAIEARPENAEAHYNLALCYENTKDVPKAEASYKKAIELDSKLVDARVRLGALYLQDPPRPKEAIAALEPALEMEKPDKTADIRAQLGFAYRLTGQLVKAESHYQAALRIQPAGDVHLAYADLLFEMGKPSETAAQLRLALPAFKKDIDKTVFIAQHFGRVGAFSDCVAAYSHAIELKSDDAGLLVYRGRCKQGLKQEPEARSDYEAALKIDPKFQAAHFFLGMSYLEQKMNGRARLHFQQAVQLGKDTPVGKKASDELRKL
jgi:Tfp pilus assembly protein PilF